MNSSGRRESLSVRTSWGICGDSECYFWWREGGKFYMGWRMQSYTTPRRIIGGALALPTTCGPGLAKKQLRTIYWKQLKTSRNVIITEGFSCRWETFTRLMRIRIYTKHIANISPCTTGNYKLLRLKMSFYGGYVVLSALVLLCMNLWIKKSRWRKSMISVGSCFLWERGRQCLEVSRWCWACLKISNLFKWLTMSLKLPISQGVWLRLTRKRW